MELVNLVWVPSMRLSLTSTEPRIWDGPQLPVFRTNRLGRAWRSAHARELPVTAADLKSAAHSSGRRKNRCAGQARAPIQPRDGREYAIYLHCGGFNGLIPASAGNILLDQK